jgi:hypothetical protein
VHVAFFDIESNSVLQHPNLCLDGRRQPPGRIASARRNRNKITPSAAKNKTNRGSIEFEPRSKKNQRLVRSTNKLHNKEGKLRPNQTDEFVRWLLRGGEAAALGCARQPIIIMD